VPLARYATAWTLVHPAVTSAIVGPRTMEQLDGLLAAGDVRIRSSISNGSTHLRPAHDERVSVLRRWLREPLVHVLVSGCAALPTPPRRRTTEREPGDRRAGRCDRGHARGVSPRDEPDASATDEQAMLDSWVADEVLVREGPRHGPRPAATRSSAAGSSRRWNIYWRTPRQIPTPTDAELETFIRAHADRYASPARISFTHVFVSATACRRGSAQRGDGAPDKLDEGADPASLGDPFLRGREIRLHSQAELASIFGAAFAAEVMQLPIDVWSAPMRSTYRHPSRAPDREAGPERSLRSPRCVRRSQVTGGTSAAVWSTRGARPDACAVPRECGASRLVTRFASCWCCSRASPTPHSFDPTLLDLREREPGLYDVVWKPAATRDGERAPGASARAGLFCRVHNASASLTRPSAEASSCSGWTAVRTGYAARRSPSPGRKPSRPTSHPPDHVDRRHDDDGRAAKRCERAGRSGCRLGCAARDRLRRYGELGIEHILEGTDHLAFVLALLLLVRAWRRLLGTITAFTLAHTITLGLAVLGVLHVPSGAGRGDDRAQHRARRDRGAPAAGARATLAHRQPWLRRLPLRLDARLGFAGALAELGFPPTKCRRLAGFNGGVEIGQLPS
jgi:hypothetical protein